MEHYRSVFATSAALVFGLVAASHIAYPRGPEEDRVRVRAPVLAYTDEAGPTAWSDPPGDMLGVAALSALAADERSAELKPATFTQLGEDTAALFSAMPVAEVSLTTARSTAAATVRRHRTVRHAVPVRTASAMPAPQATATASVQASEQASEQGEKRVDLIGSLLKGLGIEREG